MGRTKRLLLVCVLLLGGCSFGTDSLFGTYRLVGDGADPERPVTLTLERPGRFILCEARRCTSGAFTVRPIDGDGGRINFASPEAEAYMRRARARAYGSSDPELRAPAYGSVEVDYTLDWLGPQIFLTAGDDAFVKA